MFHHAEHPLQTLARFASILVGLTFLYMALFMYQDESGRLQNRLVNLWVRVNERHETFLSRQAALIRASAGLAESGLQWLFGARLISMQMVVVSFCLSVASVGLVQWFSSSAENLVARYEANVLLSIGALHFVYALIAARFLFRKGRWPIAVAFLMTISSLSALYFSFMNFGFEFPFSFVEEIGLASLWVGVAGAVFGLVCDLVLLMVNRFVIRAMARNSSMAVLLSGFSFNLLWLVLLSLMIFFPYVAVSNNLSESSNLAIMFGISSNLFNLIGSCSVLLVLLAIAFNRLFWPAASRVVYAFYQWNILTNRALQLSAAIAFLSFAFPWISSMLNLFKGK